MTTRIKMVLGVAVAVANLFVTEAHAQDGDSPRDLAAVASLGAPLPAAVRIDAPDGYVLYTGTRGDRTRLCTGDCERLVPSGRYVLSIGRAGDRPLPFAEAVDLRGRTDLHVDVESRATARSVGLGVMITGVIGSFVASLASLAIEDVETAQWTLGLGLTAGLVISSAGAFFAFQPDAVSVESVTHRSLGRRD